MATVTIRLDDDLKENAKKDLEDMGLDLSTATKIFYRQIVKTGEFPFKITTSWRDEMDTALNEAKNGIYAGEYNSLDDMRKDLYSDDED